MGSFNNFTYLDDMKQSANDPSMWEYNYRIVGTSDCEFRWQFVRDEEMTQLIYPATSASTKSDFVETTEGVVVLGADDAGANRYFGIRGTPMEKIKLQLRVQKGQVTVSLSTSNGGMCTWDGGEIGHKYFVIGSHTSWVAGPHTEMAHDPDMPGVYKSQIVIGAGRVEDFQILLDNDPTKRFHPSMPHGIPGEAIMCDPSNVAEDLSWEVFGPAGRVVEVSLDLRRQVLDEDRRNGVSARVLHDPELPAFVYT